MVWAHVIDEMHAPSEDVGKALLSLSISSVLRAAKEAVRGCNMET